MPREVRRWRCLPRRRRPYPLGWRACGRVAGCFLQRLLQRWRPPARAIPCLAGRRRYLPWLRLLSPTPWPPSATHHCGYARSSCMRGRPTYGHLRVSWNRPVAHQQPRHQPRLHHHLALQRVPQHHVRWCLPRRAQAAPAHQQIRRPAVRGGRAATAVPMPPPSHHGVLDDALQLTLQRQPLVLMSLVRMVPLPRAVPVIVTATGTLIATTTGSRPLARLPSMVPRQRPTAALATQLRSAPPSCSA